MRTWKCPDCEKTTEISYDWLADMAGRSVKTCDCDMELQPEAARRQSAAVVERLVNKAAAAD